MKKHAVWVSLCAMLLLQGTQPGFGISKEMIQMMTQLDNLQQQVQILQRTVDTQMAVLKTLVQQANENVNSMKGIVAKMQDAEQQNLASTSNRFDAMTGQIQQLSASLDETKGELSKLSDQVAQTQKIIQTINTAPPPSAAPAPQQGGPPSATAPAGANNAQPAPPPVPDPQSLYNSAYQDYTQGQYQLAIQGFQQYLQDYSDTDLASNAQFYIGDAYYARKEYKKSIAEYDKCIEQYPRGNKAAAAHLKKAYALLALGQHTAGERELHALVRRYPNTHEADLARQRLRSLTLRSQARR